VKKISLLAFVLLTACSNLASGPDKDGQEGKAYLRTTLPLIMHTWDIKEFDKYAAPELYKTSPRKRVEWFLNLSRRDLGPLRDYSVKNWMWNAGIWTGTGPGLVETYVLSARFEKASGTIRTQIMKRNNAWQITTLFVDSDAYYK